MTGTVRTGVQMNGLGPDYTMILIDGQPMVGRVAGVLDLDRVSVGNIERIEVVKGPMSSMFGSEALAGVINIITATPDDGLTGSATVQALTRGPVDSRAEVGYRRGDLQLSGFMTMNLDRHMKAHKDLFFHLVRDDGDSAEKHREFYDEYLAVMDLTSEFYLQTVDTVFVKHLMPRGLMRHRGRPVDLSAIRRVALMTIEGEKDDITGIGQCRAAQDLCSSIPADRKTHFECPKVGHYGIFNGRRWRDEIQPQVRDFILANKVLSDH